MHKAVLKNLLFQHRCALSRAEQCHHLRLQIGRKARERLRRHIHRLDRPCLARHFEARGRLFHINARLVELRNKALYKAQLAAKTLNFTTANRRGKHIGSKLDPVGHNLMGRPAKPVHTLNSDRACAVAVNLRTHLTQAVRKIDNLGLTRGVVDHSCALRKGRCHHDILSRPHRSKRKVDHRAFETPTACLGVQIAFPQLNRGAHFLQTVGVDVHWTRANRTTTRKRDNSVPFTRQKRPKHKI